MKKTLARLQGLYKFKDLVKQLVVKDIKPQIQKKAFWDMCGVF